MKRFSIVIFFSFFFLVIVINAVAVAAKAKDDTNYFKTIAPADVLMVLQQEKLKNCDKFNEKYFSKDSDDVTNIVMQATAYDLGLCRKQDLEKSLRLYIEAFYREPLIPNAPLRAGLIYEFGPQELRNKQKADFFMKQSAINLIPFISRGMKDKFLRAFLSGQPVPADLQKNIAWIEGVLKKSSPERESIAKDLEKERFKNSDLVWPFPEDMEALKLPEK